jgi:hypothetical protein
MINKIDIEKDYYAILGVLPSVDDVVLAAVYRALLKKYHPDVFHGEKEEAERRTREIVEAYGVLSNRNNRIAYKDARKTAGSGSYEKEEETNYEPYVSEEWIDLNKIHAARMDKSRRRTVVVATLFAIGIIVLASVGQQQQPAPTVASEQRPPQIRPVPTVATQDRSSQAPSVPIPQCATRPANGAILTISARNPGPNIFEFVNKRSGNAIVKIRDDASGNVVVSFFVAAGSEAAFNQIPDGKFRIQYALGGDLAQDCHSFVHAYAIYQIPGAETFISKREPDGAIYHQKLTYTLFAEASPAGNSRPHPIDATDFDAN